MELPVTLAFLFLACSTGEPATLKDSAADSGGDADTAGDTAEDTGGGDECTPITPGDDWSWTGECPQMTTDVAITIEGCELTLDYDSVGGMTMGMPYSGTIEGDTVTFADDNSVEGCVGIIDNENKITGTCDGCEFKLRRP